MQQFLRWSGWRVVLAWPALCLANDALAQVPAAMTGMATPGYSGQGLTPSATPVQWGEVQLAYDTALPGFPNLPRGHNVLMGIGLLPGLEMAGRLSTNNLQCNMYGLGDDPCRTYVQRDLSASFKLGHQFKLEQLPGWQLAAALGATDLGGAATFHRSFYGVVGVDRGPWAVQAGYAKAQSSQATLNGGFAALSWRPLDALQLQAEQIGQRRWVGAKLIWPEAWRPSGVTPWVSLQHSLQSDRFTPAHWWAMGVSIQLERPDAGRRAPAERDGGPQTTGSVRIDPATQPTVQAGEADVKAQGSSPVWQASADSRPDQPLSPVAASVQGFAEAMRSQAKDLAQRLARAGFEDISIGRSDRHVVVQAENSGYQWNDLDALGVALGLVSQTAAGAPESVDLRITRRGIVVLRVLASSDCLRTWLRAEGGVCAGGAPRFLAGARARPAAKELAVTWWVQGERASFGRPRLLFAPDLDTRVGTDYGTLDISAGVDITLQLPLWRGATADLAYAQALGHSADYDPGREFSDFRVDSQLYRVMLHQALDLGPGLAARVSVGRLFKRLDGAHAELRWQPGDGTHRLGLELSRFSHTEVDFKKRLTMASYRYFAAPIQTAFEVQGGQFWHGDQGGVVSMKHWFGDVSVAVMLRRSHFLPSAPKLYSPYGAQWVNAAGLEFTFPLTPRREHVGSLLQLRGADRFGYGVQSVVRTGHTNYLTPWFGRFAPVPMGLGDTVDNFDRGSQSYLDSNLHRVHRAFKELPVDQP